MSAFLYGVRLQWKADLRNNSAFIAFYAVPILFFFVFGSVFSSIMSDAGETLLPMMEVFAVSMAALIGVPQGISEAYQRETRSTFQLSGVPVWECLLEAEVAAVLHLVMLSAVIWVGSVLFFHAAHPASMGAFVTGLLLLIPSTLCLSGIIGLSAKNSSALSAIATGVFLPSILLSGIMFPSSMLPKALQVVGNLFPATWSYRLMCAPDIAWTNVLPLLLIISVGALVCAMMLRFIRRTAEQR